MSKSKRLMELMMAVNRKRKFTVKELAGEFGVSPRTILRDLQELSELGVPLYSEVGPHGGYQVLKQRILPPIAFSEDEAVAVFFAVHALRHYASLPFETESSSALNKFYYYMPQDTRERIDQMKQRVDFVTPARQASSPYLSLLLEAAIRQQVLLVDYESRGQRSRRELQPVGIYTRDGLWYCPAYCFRSGELRMFRCDRMHAVEPSDTEPVELRHVHLENRLHEQRAPVEQEAVTILAELTPAGVQACEAAPWPDPRLHLREDGSGWLEGEIAKRDLPYFAQFFIGLGLDITVKQPPELLEAIRTKLAELTAKYKPCK
ncbi:helix-turn-helix transcriptional regulator [Paenibacillus mucilaginosus]|uniref:Transcriptional regulator n=1 Tax=Paenibacillus mucilaginosus (strain KNP414) TaxID=1036673 RepID=F8F542_PAEMK|nr:YafY family protein [Paenibacillus mucilaginosus]AEI40772.1 transcriptional regulator [Paenibacillus mucilaginosus KNP414]MCG7211750.1 YafY family transcriptional regulator [Paenibacillus mucilaginosus]WDM29897.1 YafY family transcriptional regulator [Paenibacillus mucilaginosus]